MTLAGIVSSLRAAGCVFAEDEARILAGAADGPAQLAAMARRRASGVPLEHVVGWADFCGLRISVGDGVFVPRRRSALLVREAAARLAPGAALVDLACGSGAIGLAVAALAARTGAAPAGLHSVDIDAAAVACARRNVEASGGQVYQGDLYQPLPPGLRGQVGVIVANVPYVPSAAVAFLPPEARLHEPLTALDGGADGLDVLRRVALGAGDWLVPGGHVLLETGEDQAAPALAALDAAGLAASRTADADLGAAVVIGRHGRG